jgi:hypothetical protein
MSKKITDLLNESKGNWFEENIVGHAPLIMAIFANFVVVVADVRVYDVMFQITGSWWKALSSSLACAIPFVIWEIAWQYNHTSDNWRTTSLAMAGLAFGTSIVLGVADFLNFTDAYWSNILLGGVVILTGVHTVVGFLYYYNDPDVARKRRKAQALGKMMDNELNAEVAGTLLEQGSALLDIVAKLEHQYSPEEVEGILNILQGKQQAAPKAKSQLVRAYASDTKSPELKEKPRENPTKGRDES